MVRTDLYRLHDSVSCDRHLAVSLGRQRCGVSNNAQRATSAKQTDDQHLDTFLRISDQACSLSDD